MDVADHTDSVSPLKIGNVEVDYNSVDNDLAKTWVFARDVIEQKEEYPDEKRRCVKPHQAEINTP